jgi:tRNA uridine 5-carboxymethylaminomethyl modification enzyme
MFTSRAEFRLHLRIDNADRRLTPHGRHVGLISDEAWADFQAKQERLGRMKQVLERTRITAEMVERWYSEERSDEVHVGTAALGCPAEQSSAASGPEPTPASAPNPILAAAVGQTLAQLMKRPEVTVERLVPILRVITPDLFARDSSVSSVPSVVGLSSEVRNELKSIETEIKYEGYLLQQQRAMERLKKAEQHSIPEWFDYRSVSGLSREMQEKLTHIRPRTIGQASRIPGVTPAAVSLVNIYIEIQARRRDQAAAL